METLSSGGQPKQRGCLTYGCFISGTIATVLAAFLVFFVLRSVRSAVETFTSPQPMTVELRPLDPDVARRADEKVSRVMALLSDPVASGEVEFTAAELDAWARSARAPEFLRNNVSIGSENNELEVTFSLPVAALGDWKGLQFITTGMGERFVVGTAKGSVVPGQKGSEVRFSTLVLNGQNFTDTALKEAEGWFSAALSSAMGGSDESSGALNQSRMKRLTVENGLVKISVVPETAGGVDGR